MTLKRSEGARKSPPGQAGGAENRAVRAANPREPAPPVSATYTREDTSIIPNEATRKQDPASYFAGCLP